MFDRWHRSDRYFPSPPRAATWRLALASVALVGIACEPGAEENLASRRTLNAPPIGTSAVDRPFVVFSVPELVLTRLESPVPSPVSVGSAPSPDTMESDAPDVVSVNSAGALVAHRNGIANVRSTRGEESELRVVVVAPSALELSPSSIELRPGGEAKVAAVGDGRAIASSAVEWAITDPTVALVADGRIRATTKGGSALVRARVGDRTAYATVVVDAGAMRLLIAPRRVRLRVGGSQAFRLNGPVGMLPAEWEASDPTVVAKLQDGVFQAMQRGHATVCATASGQRSCANVEVRP